MNTQNPICNSLRALVGLATISLSSFAFAADDTNPFLGNWALTIPGGGAGWLGVTHERGYYDASLLWGGGSVVPVASVFFDDTNTKDTLLVTRINEVKR